MSHVGRRFDLLVDGRPQRVVVVGQESGWPKGAGLEQLRRRVTLESRYHHVHDVSGMARRFRAEPGFQARSPHMRGTTSALRVIFGLGLGADHSGEFLHPANGAPFHVFDGFALVNRLLCSASATDSNTGRPTSRMWQNCAVHFAATLEILEPTIVVVQGVRVGKWVQRTLAPSSRYGDHLYTSATGSGRVAVCLFSHPSARGASRWGDRLDANYLHDVVVPTLLRARDLA
jgi:uracil-DNA glycosylase